MNLFRNHITIIMFLLIAAILPQVYSLSQNPSFSLESAYQSATGSPMPKNLNFSNINAALFKKRNLVTWKSSSKKGIFTPAEFALLCTKTDLTDLNTKPPKSVFYFKSYIRKNIKSILLFSESMGGNNKTAVDVISTWVKVLSSTGDFKVLYKAALRSKKVKTLISAESFVSVLQQSVRKRIAYVVSPLLDMVEPFRWVLITRKPNRSNYPNIESVDLYASIKQIFKSFIQSCVFHIVPPRSASSILSVLVAHPEAYRIVFKGNYDYDASESFHEKQTSLSSYNFPEISQFQLMDFALSLKNAKLINLIATSKHRDFYLQDYFDYLVYDNRTADLNYVNKQKGVKIALGVHIDTGLRAWMQDLVVCSVNTLMTPIVKWQYQFKETKLEALKQKIANSPELNNAVYSALGEYRKYTIKTYFHVFHGN